MKTKNSLHQISRIITRERICLVFLACNAMLAIPGHSATSEKLISKTEESQPPSVNAASLPTKLSTAPVLGDPLPLGQDWPVKTVPSYVPNREDFIHANQKQAQDILNVKDFGAVGDGASHPLSDDFKSQSELDEKFGRGLYQLSDERDYVGVCEAIRFSRYFGTTRGKANPDLLAMIGRPEHVTSMNAVRVPAGLYVINRTIDLMGLYGFSLCGDGTPQTVFYFTKPAPLFWLQRSSNMKFKDFLVLSNTKCKSTGFYIVDDLKKDPNRQGSPTFQNVFDRLSFHGLYKAIDLAGDVMTDNEYFYSCRFLHNQIAIHQRNAQCMSVELFGCDFQCNKNALLVEAGGQINVHGGDFIANDTMLLLAPNKMFTKSTGGGSTINRNNGKFNFLGVRFEQDEYPLFDAIDDGSLLAQINFDNCAVYQRAVGKGGALGILHNGMNVVLRNLNVGPYEVKVLGDIGDFDEKRKGALIFDNIIGSLSYAEVNGLSTVFDGRKWNVSADMIVTNAADWKHVVKVR
ncbi:MAG: hypothetical protein WCI88_06770 [Chloroflexota bacterium]